MHGAVVLKERESKVVSVSSNHIVSESVITGGIATGLQQGREGDGTPGDPHFPQSLGLCPLPCPFLGFPAMG